MDNKGIIKNFISYMGRNNRQLFGWIVTWITSVLMFCISVNSEGVTKENLSAFNTVLAVMLLVIAVNMYIDKYIRFYRTKDISKIEDAAFLRNESLIEVMKSHSFDMGMYFKELYVRLIPVQIISSVLLCIAGIFKFYPMTYAALFAAIMLVVPGLAAFIRYRAAAFELNHRVGLLFKVVMGLIKGVYSFARIFVVGVSFIMLGTLALAIFSSNVVLKGFDDGTAVCITSNTGILMIIMFVAAIILCLFLTDTDREMLVQAWIKVRYVIIILALVTIVGAAGVYTYVYSKSNVVLKEDSITVNQYGSTTEYSLDDIETYRVYYKQSDETMDMEITFKDGHVENIFKGNSDSTDAWGEKYFSDYHYAYDLMSKLSDRGVVGTIDDRDRIEKTVSGYDEKIYEAYQDMLRVVSE
ncbi:MAG: hypothetical protein IJ065_06845 [Eubacterium sp.]|nr:hypothetical protein [Eubacterium sp.]